jgi:hypothetical protein
MWVASSRLIICAGVSCAIDENMPCTEVLVALQRAHVGEVECGVWAPATSWVTRCHGSTNNLPQLLTLSVVPILLPKETDAAVLKSKFKTKEERCVGACLPWQQHNLIRCQGCQPGLVSKIKLLYWILVRRAFEISLHFKSLRSANVRVGLLQGIFEL